MLYFFSFIGKIQLVLRSKVYDLDYYYSHRDIFILTQLQATLIEIADCNPAIFCIQEIKYNKLLGRVSYKITLSDSDVYCSLSYGKYFVTYSNKKLTVIIRHKNDLTDQSDGM